MVGDAADDDCACNDVAAANVRSTSANIVVTVLPILFSPVRPIGVPLGTAAAKLKKIM
jgi:hypothetical protein